MTPSASVAREDDLGYKLVESLTGEQRGAAVVDKEAPGDILTTNTRKAALSCPPSGTRLIFGSSPGVYGRSLTAVKLLTPPEVKEVRRVAYGLDGAD